MKNIFAFTGHLKHYPVMFKGLPGLSFNAYIHHDDSGVDLLLAGVRYCNGRLYPPVVRGAAGFFYNMAYMSKSVAAAIFTDLEKRYSSEYPDLFADVTVDSAVKGIALKRRMVEHYIPEISAYKAEVAGGSN